MKDMMHDIATVTAVAPAVYSADPASISIDRSGYDSVTFALMIGVGGITFTSGNRIDFILEHSDDGANWDPVGVSNVLGAVPDTFGIVASQRTAHPDPTVLRLGYVDGTIGDRRYVRLRPDFVGIHGTGTPLSAIAILGVPREMPVAA